MPITGFSSAIIATTRRPRRRSPACRRPADRAGRGRADGPTTKADCLNHLYDALRRLRNRARRVGQGGRAPRRRGCRPPARASDFRPPDRPRGGRSSCRSCRCPIRDSRWISGHYCDEFAEAHVKELVVREAVGAAIPLAGVGCAIARAPLARLAALQDGRPFAGNSMTEDYEIGLQGRRAWPEDDVRAHSGARRASAAWSPAAAISRRRWAPRCARRRAGWAASRLPAGTGSAGAAGLASAGCGMRDRRGPLAALLLHRRLCAPHFCGRNCGSPKRSARRSRRGSTRRWSRC